MAEPIQNPIKIDIVRREKGISTADLAERANVNKRTLGCSVFRAAFFPLRYYSSLFYAFMSILQPVSFATSFAF